MSHELHIPRQAIWIDRCYRPCKSLHYMNESRTPHINESRTPHTSASDLTWVALRSFNCITWQSGGKKTQNSWMRLERSKYMIHFARLAFRSFEFEVTRSSSSRFARVTSLDTSLRSILHFDSRLLKIIGLFCKRALWKRRYSEKETCDLKEPTNRSHPIARVASLELLRSILHFDSSAVTCAKEFDSHAGGLNLKCIHHFDSSEVTRLERSNATRTK